MEAKAQAKYVRCTPMKARRVVDVVRGKKVIESAIANARVKAERAGERFDESQLFITEVFADEGPTLKRFRPRAQGRASRILKRTSHITVIVGDKADAAKKEGAR